MEYYNKRTLMPKLTTEINYVDNDELIKHRKSINRMLRLGIKSFSGQDFRFSLDHEMTPKIRIEKINGKDYVVLQSKMNE